jgi:pyruvate-formate lyase-activating enzyme
MLIIVLCEFIQQKQQQKASELDGQLNEYIEEWRKQRRKEEEELKRLKEKQAKRKVLINKYNKERDLEECNYCNEAK